MNKFILTATCFFFISALHAQTCVGTFHFKLFDAKTKKPVSDKLEKNVIYAFTDDEMEFYDDTEPVFPIDTILTKRTTYHVKVNEKGYELFPGNEPGAVDFANRCGLYLVHIDFIGKNDTMSIGFYNIPAHQSFQIDSVFYEKGYYFIDFQASSRLHEFRFLDDKGYFLVPRDQLKPLPKTEE